MQERNVDVAIIGAGTAGLSAYRAAVKNTKNVVLIEGGPYGTTCARVGCMPSKLLIAAAEVAHSAGHASNFGVNVKGIVVDGKAVMKRVKSERDRFVGFVLESVDSIDKNHLMRGHAQFIAPLTLKIENQGVVKAKSIVIATGSTPILPPFLKNLKERVLINDDIFEWDDLPKSLAVFGTGIIGLEIGQALSRLGVEVTIFGRSGRVSPLTDPVCADYAVKCFSKELNLILKANVIEAKNGNNSVEITFLENESKEITKSFDYVLAAIGRKPNLKNLSLENADLVLDDFGIPEFDPYTTQCGNSSVFIAGDVNNFRPLLHEAADEGRIAGTAAANFPEVSAGLRRSALAVIFTEPQIAMAGKRFNELKKDTFEFGEVSFENQGRSRVLLKNQGVLRVYGEHGSGKFLGAEMIGPSAEHIGHLLSWAHQQGMTISGMLEMPFYHPVIEEGLRTALRDLNSKLKLGPKPVKDCIDCGPGA